jgi:glycosyltransferase involved in cell wall biosynthesis
MAKNAQETLYACLEALDTFEEVILYLNDSTDNSEAIASTFKNTTIVKGEFIGFGPTKNAAASHAKNDWILSLDSDEILNTKLIFEIQSQDYSDPYRLFVLKRDNYFLGYKTISQDHIIRLYNKSTSRFNNNAVHEKIIPSTKHHQITLKKSFKHLNITDINQTLTKMIKYTDLGAKEKKTCFFSIVIFKALFAFIQTYFIRFYFLNGWVGFTIAISNANRRFYKYLKQFINCQKSKS